MFDGDEGFGSSSAADDPLVSGYEEVGIALVGDRDGGDAQGAFEVAVAVFCRARFGPAGGTVVARADARPGREVRSGGENVHVTTGLGDDHVSDQGRNSRDGR